ncbi:GNAT family N-acetyltransferase [uncultured Aeromicrobium sp.]|uniref:GNAT family N-acetyltransferase n=1 Tax=uncultured Aeromicrobium sp. TaxID=337820 RepID=UPI0025EF00F7|nr:GNAT family N-acetyltransferase [uncultured Aeromicrobium sp.]
MTRLRPFQPEDYAAIAAWVRDPDELRAFAGDRLRWPLVEREFLDLLDVPGRTAWTMVSRDDPHIPIGHMQLTQTDAVTRISRLIVDPALRRTGCGRALLDHAIRLAGPGAPIHLSVVADNSAALRLYLHKGFLPIGRDGDILAFARSSGRLSRPTATELFDELAEAMSWLGVRRAHMMGRPMLSIDRRMLACLDDDQLGLRLGRETRRHGEALTVAGTHLFTPGNRGRVFRDWIALPIEAGDDWPVFTYDALENTRRLNRYSRNREPRES